MMSLDGAWIREALYVFGLHQSSQGACIPVTSIENKLHRGELWPNILANVVCFGNMIAQLDLFWPSSWHVNFHFYLFGVSVNHILLRPDCLLARTFPNVLMPKNLLLWCGQQTEPRLNLLVLLVLEAACKSPFTPPAWIPVHLPYHSQTKEPSASLSACITSCQHCHSPLCDAASALGVAFP